VFTKKKCQYWEWNYSWSYRFDSWSGRRFLQCEQLRFSFNCREKHIKLNNQIFFRFFLKSWKRRTIGCTKTGNENFPNVNLVLSICQLIVYLTIPIKWHCILIIILTYLSYERIVKCVNFTLTVPVFFFFFAANYL
jgi:hypothetical protein